jgi:hypothetical protein
MDIVIRFMFIVGRRRMAARLETELILPAVPFFKNKVTLPPTFPHPCLTTPELECGHSHSWTCRCVPSTVRPSSNRVSYPQARRVLNHLLFVE